MSVKFWKNYVVLCIILAFDTHVSLHTYHNLTYIHITHYIDLSIDLVINQVHFEKINISCVSEFTSQVHIFLEGFKESIV